MRLRKKNKRRKEKQKSTAEYTAILSDISELHQKYIQLFIDLHTHYTVVDENFYILAKSALTEQYESELALLMAQAQHETNEKFYLANGKTETLGIWTYKRLFRRRRNSVMKQVLDERINNEASGYITELCAGLEPPQEDEAAGAAAEAEPAEQTEEQKMLEEYRAIKSEALQRAVEKLISVCESEQERKIIEELEAEELESEELEAEEPPEPEDDSDEFEENEPEEEPNELDELYELESEELEAEEPPEPEEDSDEFEENDGDENSDEE